MRTITRLFLWRGVSGQAALRSTLWCLLLLSLLLFFPSPVSADNGVSNGSFTLIANSTHSYYNFTTGTVGAAGHIRLTNFTGYSAVVGRSGNASIISLGIFWGDSDGQEFFEDFYQVANTTVTPFFGARLDYIHDTSVYTSIYPNNVLGVRFLNGSGHVFYGAAFARTVFASNNGTNATFAFFFNNQSVGHLHGNNTFMALGACANNTNFTSCVQDHENRCHWSESGLCIGEEEDEFNSDSPPADCEMLPRYACDLLNSSYCAWNVSQGAQGLCTPGSLLNHENGFNCSAILNHSFCTNQSFTEKTGFCTWNSSNTICLINRSKTHDNVADAPVFSCEAPGYVNNQSNCNILIQQFFMPCAWNETTGRCSAGAFDFGQFTDFEDISSESTCRVMGGIWRSETTFDPLSNSLSTQTWCEFGGPIRTFSEIGGGGGDFRGSTGSLNDCSQDCFACEFNSTGGRWPNSTIFRQQCESSPEGCFYQNDSNAFNGFGWCKSTFGGGGFSCDSFCGDCNLLPNPQSSCLNSTADCRWDNVTHSCFGSGAKTCQQDCFQCDDNSSCVASPASGGCTWDSDLYLCKPKSGKFEICFDGVDNDNNGDIDCDDFKCGGDPFCGGGNFDTNNCFQYDEFTYGGIPQAQGNCTNATGCTWITEVFNFSYCAPLSELCWINESLFNDPAGCANVGGGNVCAYVAEGTCHENETLFGDCGAKGNAIDCNAIAGCKWSPFGFCDVQSIVVCEDNETLQFSQSECVAQGCRWQGNQFGFGFEGFGADNCVSPCIDRDITAQTQCNNATRNATPFYNQTCVWFAGHCESKNFIGGCIQNDGDISACRANSNCRWSTDFNGPLHHPNGSVSFSDMRFPQATWVAIGLQHPIGLGVGAKNESSYLLNRSAGAFLELVQAKGTENTPVRAFNVARLYCNTTLLVQYNWSATDQNGSCNVGSCNVYNTTTCDGATVHYYLSNKTKAIEALWEVSSTSVRFDAIEANANVTNVTNTSTIVVNGNLSEQIPENATANDGTNATRVLTASGFCDDTFSQSFFQQMDHDAPLPIAADASGDVTSSGADYLDFIGLGMKKTPEAFAYGMPTVNMNYSAVCAGVPLNEGQSIGAGNNLSRYYLYLDTNGSTTGGCSPLDNSSLTGFEYLFKYVAEIADNRFAETLLTQQCTNGQWVSSSVSFRVDRTISCSFVDGPMFAIGKEGFSSKPNVNTSAAWRAYATSASAQGNASNVSDRIGPGTANFQGIDMELVDCTSTSGSGSSSCSTFTQFGFFPGEFGPACGDSKDNDADGLIDCADFDCKYDPYFCSGSFSAVAGDTTAPTIV